jgi:hypothetical protein
MGLLAQVGPAIILGAFLHPGLAHWILMVVG